MRFTASLVLAVAGAVSAFIVPPEVNNDGVKDIVADFQSLTEDIYKQADGFTNMKTLVELRCDACYGNGKDNGVLILDIEIPEPEKNTLVINGASIIPFGRKIALTVPMIKQDHSVLKYLLLGTDDSLVDVHLGYDLMITEIMLGDQKAINANIKVNSVDGREVPAGSVDSVELTLHKDAKTGELNLLKLDLKREAPKKFEEEKFTCTSLFCQLRKMIDDQFQTFKEKAEAQFDTVKSKFGGKKGCQGGEGAPAALPNGFDITDHPHRRPYRPHHHDPHVMHDVQNDNPDGSGQLTLFKIFRQVLFPIFIGVVAGMAVSLVGMVIGHFAVMAYQRIKGIVPRCPHAERRRRARQDAGSSEDESSKALLATEERTSEEQDAPPSYRDVEESVNVAVVDNADEKQ